MNIKFMTGGSFRLSNPPFLESWVLAELSPKEAGLIKPNDGRGTYNTGSIGYIDPKKVRRYFVGKEQREYEGAPKLKIHIRDREPMLGEYGFYHEADEGQCVLIGYILPSDKPDPRYIILDDSGKFISITRERIEKEIRNARDVIDGGEDADMEIAFAERLAKNGGLDFAKELTELRKYNESSELTRYRSPENLKEVISELKELMGYTSFEHLADGAGEELDKFLERLPTLDMPPELKPAARQVITSYIGLYAARKEETGAQIQKLTGSMEADSAEIRRLRSLISGI